MKSYEKLLFIYSIFFTTISVLVLLLFAPKPANFIYILFLLPLNFYFWLRLVGFGKAKEGGKEKISTGKGVFVFMILVLIVSALLTSISTYFISLKYLEKESNNGNLATEGEIIEKAIVENEKKISMEDSNEILKELTEIKDELAVIRANQRGINQTLGIASDGESLDELLFGLEGEAGQETTLGSILVKEPYEKVDAHEEPTASSRVVGSINPDDVYFYTNKNGDWYLVETDQKTKGWVQSSFVLKFTSTEE